MSSKLAADKPGSKSGRGGANRPSSAGVTYLEVGRYLRNTEVVICRKLYTHRDRSRRSARVYSYGAIPSSGVYQHLMAGKAAVVRKRLSSHCVQVFRHRRVRLGDAQKHGRERRVYARL